MKQTKSWPVLLTWQQAGYSTLLWVSWPLHLLQPWTIDWSSRHNLNDAQFSTVHMWAGPHLSTFMVNKQIPGVFLLPIWDLQAVSVAYLLGLEHYVQVLHVDHTFGNLGLPVVAGRESVMHNTHGFVVQPDIHQMVHKKYPRLLWQSIWVWTLAGRAGRSSWETPSCSCPSSIERPPVCLGEGRSMWSIRDILSNHAYNTLRVGFTLTDALVM